MICEQCIQMACGSAQPQEVPTTHQNIMFPCENTGDYLLQWTISVIRPTISQNVRERERET